MEINKDRLWKLLDDVADGKYRKLARLLGLQQSQVHKVLNTDSKAGPVFLGKIHKYCKENSLDFDEFVVHESNPERGEAHAAAERRTTAD